MTEKQYGGKNPFDFKNKFSENPNNIKKEIKINQEKEKQTENPKYEIEKLIQAGKIASQVKEYSRSIIKKDIPLLEIAEKIESKIFELGGKPAFPINISINETAAHDNPSHDDKRLAYGLLKVDLGVHINGFIADTALSIDLENSEENKNLILSAEKALEKALEKISLGIELYKIGQEIESTIKSFGFVPIHNLSGHAIENYELHSGLTIPNINNSQNKKIIEGIYAIEPFSTNGFGEVKDGKPSGIYEIIKEGNVRDAFAREVLLYIKENYKTLPFCSRWLYKKFDSRCLISLKRIEEAGIIRQFNQLIEKNSGKVAQAEHTIIILKDKKIITTK